MQIIDCEQGTPEWYAARLGIPTASAFSIILSATKDAKEKKTRTEYMRKLAGEIITGEPMDSYSNAHMERGKVMEDEARDLYAFMTDSDPQRVGFVRDGNRGCSPDSLIGDKGGLEIKTALPHIQIDRLLKGTLPAEHKAQVQGNIWLCKREWWDFVSYSPKLPPLIVRVFRDDGYIANLSGSVDQFNAELAEMVETISRFGMKEAA
jgi:hypothetical protein